MNSIFQLSTYKTIKHQKLLPTPTKKNAPKILYKNTPKTISMTIITPLYKRIHTENTLCEPNIYNIYIYTLHDIKSTKYMLEILNV